MALLARAAIPNDPDTLGLGLPLIFGPIVVAIALVTWLTLVGKAAGQTKRVNPNHPDQSSHRGPMQGGLYSYSPGMYSHSYAPTEAEYLDPPSETGYPPLAQDRPQVRQGTDVGILEREVKRGTRPRRRWRHRGERGEG
ncbi:hypothetical protein [Spirillospora sp. NPDC029432]|uniref:hypothetical protein n=1 Tax=Spirillospora sp. NPDC029432 TaxID=3154599 RepID=UPI00345197A2